jgi:nucleotide-binding universal stress UspA family protein
MVTPKNRIVVGVDGSESSKAALRWAMRQAKLDGARVEVVTAWEYPAWFGFPPPVARFDLEENASRSLTDAIAVTAREFPGCEVASRIVEGSAARVLIDAAKGADMLVVGNRGYGGFTEALLGSVSQHCTHHAQCPVVVIRDA